MARLLDRLASFRRLVLLDKRGIGLSDPVSLTAVPTLEGWMDDLRAVLDAEGIERAAILTGARRPPETDRVLTTVLFTDIVGSTERAAALGDRGWKEFPRTSQRAGPERALELPRPRDRHRWGWLPGDVRWPRTRDPVRAGRG